MIRPPPRSTRTYTLYPYKHLVRSAGRLRGPEPVTARERGSAGPAARVRRTAGRVRSGRPRAGRVERLMTRPTRGDGPGRAYPDLQNRARRERRGTDRKITRLNSSP